MCYNIFLVQRSTRILSILKTTATDQSASLPVCCTSEDSLYYRS